MSDRFVLHASKEEVETLFGVSTQREDYFEPDYNITPGTLVPVVFREGGENNIYQFLWGMIPTDAEEEKEGKEYYEWASKGIEENEELKKSFRDRRCIIPANGFYKWKTTKKKSTPFYIRMLSNELMGIAGLYSVWQSKSGRNVYSFTMLTTEANALVQPVDDRMPVILRPENYDLWLGKEEIDSGKMETFLKPFQLTEMAVNRVSEAVNDPTNNGPELIQPIPK